MIPGPRPPKGHDRPSGRDQGRGTHLSHGPGGGPHLSPAPPLTQFVEAFRDVVYLLQAPSLSRLLYLTVISAVVFLLGFAYFQRGSRDVAELL